jgi:hypothetical protein
MLFPHIPSSRDAWIRTFFISLGNPYEKDLNYRRHSWTEFVSDTALNPVQLRTKWIRVRAASWRLQQWVVRIWYGLKEVICSVRRNDSVFWKRVDKTKSILSERSVRINKQEIHHFYSCRFPVVTSPKILLLITHLWAPRPCYKSRPSHTLLISSWW